ncbi:GntR family transcriptional regulator [Streptomyces durmitorensis]|uniref:GntR family transcriptional regulator n=1 Tax=Streptomyces durmitorensis TaxID=319947 RepID=A0ABY4PW06_9ACTN|nr:GntR family transcriptional regulator [Streptomyces durmitorensis]UQT57295.1 GntR family transcriptional regulator [Streptomyces durmitorensis]
MAKAYEEIADELRAQIRAGRLGPGDRLPSESDLVRTTGRSGPTVQQALRVLQAEGLIEKQHGRGTFVRRPRTPIERTNARHQWEKDRARAPERQRLGTGATERDTGLGVDDLVFHAAYREIGASKEIAAALGVAEGTALVERTYRTRYSAERNPFSLVTSLLIRDLVQQNPDLLDETKEPWPGGTWNQLLTVGIEIDRVEERVTARPPTVEEADELGLPPGTSVLVLRKTLYDTDDRIVEMSDVTLPGDRTEMLFTTHLERW